MNPDPVPYFLILIRLLVIRPNSSYRAPHVMSKIERIKAETDGLDVLPELLRAAREGWETMSPEHIGLLKWYGLYAHNTGDGHFMMRVKVI